MADNQDGVSSDDAALFDINSSNYDDFSANDTEDPVGGKGPLHHRPKGKSRDQSMNDPFPEMFVARPSKIIRGAPELRKNAFPGTELLTVPGQKQVDSWPRKG